MSGSDKSVVTADPDNNDDSALPAYQTYNDDHKAENLDDFGLDLPVDETEGVLVPVDELSNIRLHWPDNKADIDHAIVHPVGVGPAKPGVFEDVSGTKSVFANIHLVKKHENQAGHYMQAEHPTTVRLERDQLRMFDNKHTTVKPLNREARIHWQNPANDPYGHCEPLDY